MCSPGHRCRHRLPGSHYDFPPVRDRVCSLSVWGNAKTLFGFFALPLISMVVTFAAVPVLVREGGADGWAAVAVAQGVGNTAALVVSFGWLTVGPAEIARSSPDHQRHIYWLSFVMRAGLFVFVTPLAVGVTLWLASDAYLLTAALVTMAFVLQGMSPGWYLVGQGRPLAIAWMETGPRAAAQLVSIVVVSVSGDLIWYGVILIAFEIAVSVIGFLVLAQRHHHSGAVLPQIRPIFRQQWPLAWAAIVGAGYTRAAVPVVSGISYSSAPTFGALDRVQLIGRSGLRPLVSFFQGWVVRAGADRQAARSLVATSWTVGLGLVGGGLIAAVLPQLDFLLFSGVIEISSAQAALLGATLVFVAGSFSTGLYYLVPRGNVRVLAISSFLGSAIGVPLLLLLTSLYGATGAMAAVAIVEAVVLVWQTTYLMTSGRG